MSWSSGSARSLVRVGLFRTAAICGAPPLGWDYISVPKHLFIGTPPVGRSSSKLSARGAAHELAAETARPAMRCLRNFLQSASGTRIVQPCTAQSQAHGHETRGLADSHATDETPPREDARMASLNLRRIDTADPQATEQLAALR